MALVFRFRRAHRIRLMAGLIFTPTIRYVSDIRRLSYFIFISFQAAARLVIMRMIVSVFSLSPHMFRLSSSFMANEARICSVFFIFGHRAASICVSLQLSPDYY